MELIRRLSLASHVCHADREAGADMRANRWADSLRIPSTAPNCLISRSSSAWPSRHGGVKESIRAPAIFRQYPADQLHHALDRLAGGNHAFHRLNLAVVDFQHWLEIQCSAEQAFGGIDQPSAARYLRVLTVKYTPIFS